MTQSGSLFVLGSACLLACWIAYRAWMNRETTGARILAGVALSTAVWAGGTIGLMLATSPANVAAENLTLARENDNGEYLARADRALNRMETLIDDLLALAHGGASVDLASVRLGAVVDDAWSTVDTKEATLKNRASLSIVADRSRLHQLIANLLRNAVEHGGASVTVTIGGTENGFYVADDGPGIPPDEQERVFDTGYSTRDAGTGLGLNIVQEIADAHGWGVRARDGAEGGASFEITDVEIAE